MPSPARAQGSGCDDDEKYTTSPTTKRSTAPATHPRLRRRVDSSSPSSSPMSAKRLSKARPQTGAVLQTYSALDRSEQTLRILALKRECIIQRVVERDTEA